jgi:membrane protease YdiL (CAAX protease family)
MLAHMLAAGTLTSNGARRALATAYNGSSMHDPTPSSSDPAHGTPAHDVSENVGRSPRAELKETLIVFAASIAACSILWQLRGLPVIRSLLHDLIAAIFLLVPAAILLRRNEPFAAYGLTIQPLGRGLLFGLGAFMVIAPLFTLGLWAYYRTICGFTGRDGQLAIAIYRGLCRRFSGRFHGSRIPLDWRYAWLVVSQLGVVALPEEFFFRGYVQTKLERVWPPRRRVWGGGLGLALIITSVMFALGHVLVDFNPMRFAVFFPSLLFGWLRGASGTIVAPVLMHAGANLLSDALHRGFF